MEALKLESPQNRMLREWIAEWFTRPVPPASKLFYGESQVPFYQPYQYKLTSIMAEQMLWKHCYHATGYHVDVFSTHQSQLG